MCLNVRQRTLQTSIATTHRGTIDAAADHKGATRTLVLVAARDEAARLAATLAGLARAFPQGELWVADDGSRDSSALIARAAGARVVRGERPLGKGGAITRAAREALRGAEPATVVVLCDGDLGASAGELAPLAGAVRGGADLAVAGFRTRAGGGFGVALGFARWAIRRRCGMSTRAPLSGQRALTAATLGALLPLARGYGMEVGMTIDVVRAGGTVAELELELEHRVLGRTPAGFLHRARQLADCARAYAARGGAERVTLGTMGGTALR